MPIKPAFSAVELLLVAGISAILVAIAVPGYMEAKARAETSDVQNTLRQVEIALYQYKVDYNQYPEASSLGSPNPLRRLMQAQLISFEPVDRFKDDNLRHLGGYYSDQYLWYGYMTPEKQEFSETLIRINKAASLASSNSSLGFVPDSRYWFLKSIGPDRTDWHDEGGERNSKKTNILGMVEYNPTNGVFSLGEIYNIRNF
ncbi:MAG: hypothetical protein JXR73_22210 [Candidatus Omnitrophica bacterium]|nr:hypothetical protein [Candidatus Omnitrophota bacterium]